VALRPLSLVSNSREGGRGYLSFWQGQPHDRQARQIFARAVIFDFLSFSTDGYGSLFGFCRQLAAGEDSKARELVADRCRVTSTYSQTLVLCPMGGKQSALGEGS
jgi:hypothetical protein